MGNIIKAQDSRREFVDTLIELSKTDPTIVLIVPDVGFNYVSKFSEKFPADIIWNIGDNYIISCS